MPGQRGNRPAEIFGYSIQDHTDVAADARKRHHCPFASAKCNKKSRLIKYPFGVCSVVHHEEVYAVCPRRFEEQGDLPGIPRTLQDIAHHYFGELTNLIVFPEVFLPNVGSIDFVLVRHKPMKAEVDDFVAVEFQTDSTTSTGELVKGLTDFVRGRDISAKKYKFGLNTYDTIKRSMTQLFNKGIVYEGWGVKTYWVIQEYIYANLVRRYGLRREGFVAEHASRFAIYEIIRDGVELNLRLSRIVSTTVDEVYQAMRHNPSLPGKDEFVSILNTKLRARLQLKIEN